MHTMKLSRLSLHNFASVSLRRSPSIDIPHSQGTCKPCTAADVGDGTLLHPRTDPWGFAVGAGIYDRVQSDWEVL